jgi:SAM-dependent methyltransferase
MTSRRAVLGQCLADVTTASMGWAGMAELKALLAGWRGDLASWAIPEHITAAVTETPWVLPREVFARRADRESGAPSGPSYDRAWAALDPPGSVLDVGAGAGAASLPLAGRITSLTTVDSDTGMLELIASRAGERGITARCVPGSWLEVAAGVPPADLVTCHHVLYNVPDLAPFVTALTGHARRAVVVEVTARHPLVTLNGLWLRFHGLRRPESPVADDLLRILEEMGLNPSAQRWSRPAERDYASLEELADVTRRRLCLPPERTGEVAAALAETGAAPQAGLASAGREVVTIWWPGTAG